MRLDRCYLIVDSTEWVARLVPLGVRLVQLRIKERSQEEVRAEIRATNAVCLRNRAQLIVNDYWQLAIEERITEWKRLAHPKPLVAIGGLTVERLPGVFAAGADSAAVVTDIIRHAQPEARTREWLAAT